MKRLSLNKNEYTKSNRDEILGIAIDVFHKYLYEEIDKYTISKIKRDIVNDIGNKTGLISEPLISTDGDTLILNDIIIECEEV